jgi:SAM-dependent methyltransferase
MTPPDNIFGFYDDDYLHFAAHTLGQDRTQNEVSFIWEILSLRAGDCVLDAGCGHGRIANALAKRGARVTGVDIVPKFLAYARKEAAQKGLPVDYRQADIREAVEAGPFDAAILWFFSFGYHSDQENLKVLRNIASVLKPGAQLLLDQYNVSALARAADHYSVVDLQSSLLIQKPIWDLEASRWGAERIVIRDGAIRRSSFMCRCYSPAELKEVLLQAGFSGPKFMGDGFQELSLDSSRLIVLATKRAESEQL